MREAVREILDPTAGLALDERLGRLDRHEIGRGFEHLVADGHLRLQHLHRLDPRADVGAQLVDGLELARFVDPLVGELGQHLLLGLFDDDAELRVVAGELTETLGQRAVNSRIAPGFVPRS